MKQEQVKPQLLVRRSVVFSVTIFLLVFIIGSAVFMLSMRELVKSNKDRELVQTLDNKRITIEASIDNEIGLAVKMGGSPIIRRFFANPADATLREYAFEEIEAYRESFASQNVFWINDTDREYYFNGEHKYTLDINDPSSEWYVRTLAQEQTYSINVNYDIGIQRTMLWVNVLVRKEGRTLGLAGTGIDITSFLNEIYSGYKDYAALYFFSADGVITGARKVDLVIEKRTVEEEFGETGALILAAANALGKNEGRVFSTPLGEVGIMTVSRFGWFALAVSPNAARDYMTAMTWLFLSMIAVILIVLVVFNIRIVQLAGPLLRALKDIDAASKHKSEFLAKMSHEIRTPMNAIIGMAELVLRVDRVPPAAREHVRIIKRAGANLLSIINDILDISKIESGKFEIICADYHFSTLVNDVVNIITARTAESGLRFIVNVDDNIPNGLFGDEIRIRQILLNILSNAVKYTEKGSVSFAVKGGVVNDDTVILTAVVSDTGKGIKEEDVAKLFGDFVQVDTRSNRGIEGTGLGLSIARKLAVAMGGDITVKSVYGEGSAFTITLPQKIRRRESQPKLFDDDDAVITPAFIAPDAKALVVDDVKTNLEVAKGLMSIYELKIDVCLSGADAVNAAKTNAYDIIFMDQKMPEMSGAEAAKLIRGAGGDFPHLKNVPIIALTADALTGTKETLLKNGFDDFLSKPIDTNRLNEILERWIPANKRIADDNKTGAAANAVRADDVRIDGVDVKLGVARTGGKFANYLKTLEIFCEDGREKIREIKKTFADDDLSSYTICVHALKSALANIGAQNLSGRASDLEDAGNRGDRIFIGAHTEKLLSDLKTLLSDIDNFVFVQKEKQAQDQNHQKEIDTNALKSILADLKTALDNVEPSAINEAVKKLEPFENAAGGVGEKIRAIMRYILDGDYEEAAAAALAV